MRILFVHLGMESFVHKDLEILQSAHTVRPLYFRGLGDIPALWKGVRWSDLTFSWFGTVHAFFAVAFSKILRRKSVVVSGGYDVAGTPLLPRYGPLNKPYKRNGVLFVFANADLILCVSHFNCREAIVNAGADPQKVRVVPHGFDTQVFRPVSGIPKQEMVLTVGGANATSIPRKGLDLFVQSAAYLPEVRFVLVGRHNESALSNLQRIAPPNVDFQGWLPLQGLLEMYTQAKVYLQPSRHEAFGCSVAEAMLCTCVPVVSREGALPEVVGDCGFYVERLTPDAVAAVVRDALENDLGARARQRVLESFPLSRRRQEILKAIQEV